ncbi:MAG: peptidylprolyl isomerase [bacterium]|nr:peptidylprolyl isomerase [bacterium]
MNFLNSKRYIQFAAFFICIFIAFTAVAEEQKAAEINGVVITQAQFDKELNIHLDRVLKQGQQISEDQKAGLKKEILEGLIERELLYQESQKVGIKVDDQMIDEQLAAIKKRFPGEAEFKIALGKMNLTEDKVKMQIARGLAIRQLIEQQVTSKIVITDVETKAYYDGNPQMFKQPEQVKASHILIKVDPGATEVQKAEARKKIDAVQQKIKDVGDFAELAKEYSEGPSNTRGGDLGFFRRGQMVKPFDDTVFDMKTNEISDIVETRFGYHIIKVYDKKPEETLAYAEVKEKLNQRMKQEKVEKDANLYVNQLKKEANIEKYI